MKRRKKAGTDICSAPVYACYPISLPKCGVSLLILPVVNCSQGKRRSLRRIKGHSTASITLAVMFCFQVSVKVSTPSYPVLPVDGLTACLLFLTHPVPGRKVLAPGHELQAAAA